MSDLTAEAPIHTLPVAASGGRIGHLRLSRDIARILAVQRELRLAVGEAAEVSCGSSAVPMPRLDMQVVILEWRGPPLSFHAHAGLASGTEAALLRTGHFWPADGSREVIEDIAGAWRQRCSAASALDAVEAEEGARGRALYDHGELLDDRRAALAGAVGHYEGLIEVAADRFGPERVRRWRAHGWQWDEIMKDDPR